MHKRHIISGDLLETYTYERDLPIRRSSRGKGSFAKRNHRVAHRSDASIRRAATSFRRVVRANLGGDERPALLTLTTYSVIPYATSVNFFTAFIARIRRRHGRAFKYIAVPELQKRGSWHWHVLIWGLGHEAEKERTTRHFARFWLRGFCDCVITDGHSKIASYLAKYLSKAMSHLRRTDTKTYYTSRNILRPVSVNASSLAAYTESQKKVIHRLTTLEYQTEWLGKCEYNSYRIES